MEGAVSMIFYYFEWFADLIDNLLDSARVGIGLDLNTSLENVANFEVLGWGDIRVLRFTMASAAFFDKNF